MKTKWTPGPWYYRPEEPSVEAEYENSAGWFVTVADCGKSNNIPSETMQSNALLISLAPELAEALKAVLVRFEAEYMTLTDGEFGTTATLPEVKTARSLLARLEGGEK